MGFVSTFPKDPCDDRACHHWLSLIRFVHFFHPCMSKLGLHAVVAQCFVCRNLQPGCNTSLLCKDEFEADQFCFSETSR
jgi:hypothetical protein